MRNNRAREDREIILVTPFVTGDCETMPLRDREDREIIEVPLVTGDGEAVPSKVQNFVKLFFLEIIA